MPDNVQGLTVAIAADASKFKSAMKDLRNDSKSAQSELNALQKSLELEFDPKKLERAQKAAQAAIDATAQKADLLKARLAHLEESGNVDTTEYKKLASELAAVETQGLKLQQQLEKINNIKFTALGGQISSVGSKFTAAGKALTPFSAAAGATLTGLGALGAKAVSAADDVATLATQYDMSATALQRFNYVALQTDTSAEDLYKSFVKVRAGVADIASGTTSAASTALKKLKLDFNSFDGTEEQFYAIIDALASMEDKTQMVAIANDIFGDKLANNILPLIYAGTDAINEYCAEFDSLGALTDEQVASLAEFDNVLNKLKTQLKNVALQIGASLLPVMQRFAEIVSNTIIPKLQTLADWFNSLSLSQQEFAVKALMVVAALAPLALGIGKIVSTVGSIIQAIPALNSALAALAANPIVLIIAAVAAILIILYTQCEAFRESISNLVSMIGSALQPLLDVIMGLLQSVMDLLSPILEILGGILGTVINLVVTALQPFFDIVSIIFELLKPLLTIALIPIQLAFKALEVPLKVLGQLLGWLSPIFEIFGGIVSKIFGGVVKIINIVLGVIEDAVNFVIGIINGLIDGVNAALGWLGVHIDHIADVKLRIDTSDIESMDDVNAIIDTTPPDSSLPGNAYDKIGGESTSGDVYNNDYSTNNTTQNVTVVIENYAAEIDVDEMVNKINVKLAEAM